MLDREVILSRVALIEGHLAHLERLGETDPTVFRSDPEKWASARYLLQTVVEAMADIGNHIIAARGWGAPQTYQDVFALLAEHGVLDPAQLPALQAMARFRNLVVHLYHAVDNDRVLGYLRHDLGDVRTFLAAVRRCIDAEP